MFRIMICLILGVGVGVLSAPSALNMKDSNMDLKGNILIVNDLEEARSLYPGAEFTEMERNDETKGVVQYTLGNRVNGDRLVAQGSDNKQWSQPQNVQLLLEYPTSGTGAVVTFIQVIVDQSSNLGQAYVISGGIGQRKIAVVIEAKNTIWCRWAAGIYGL